MKLLIVNCLLLLLAVGLGQASVLPAVAATGVAVPATGVAVPTPALVPVAASHQFVTRNYNGYYVPSAWPAWSSYPNTYYKYSGGYPTYAYPSYGYPYGYGYSYPGYNYGYGYKSVW